jgi:hypothetical protein
MVTAGTVLSLSGERRGTSRLGLLFCGRGGGDVRRRRIVGRHHTAHEVGPQVHDLGDLVGHQLQDGGALGGLQVAELLVQFGRTVGQRGGHLEESLCGDHRFIPRSHGRRGGCFALTLDGREPPAPDAWIVTQVLHVNSPSSRHRQ